MDLEVFIGAHTSLIFTGILLGYRALNLTGSAIFLLLFLSWAIRIWILGPLCLCEGENKVLARAILCKDFFPYRQ